MDKKTMFTSASRRRFLFQALPAGAFFCLGSKSLWASLLPLTQKETVPSQHKFSQDSEMSFKALFKFTFQNYYIPCLERLAGEIGRDNLLEMLKRLNSDAVAKRQKESIKDLPNTDFEDFLARSRAGMNRFVKHVLTWEDGEKTEKSVRTRFTECLFSSTGSRSCSKK